GETINEEALSTACRFKTVQDLEARYRITVRIVRMETEGVVRIRQMIRVRTDGHIEDSSIICLAYPAYERGCTENLAFLARHPAQKSDSPTRGSPEPVNSR